MATGRVVRIPWTDEYVLYFGIDLSAVTNTVTRSLGMSSAKYNRVVEWGIMHEVAGVGAQNITYTAQEISGAGVVTDLTSTIVLANAGAAGTKGTANGLAGKAVDGEFGLRLNVVFAAAVTSGPVIGGFVRFER